MNDTLDYKISVMQAYRAGEKIEHRNTKRAHGGETEWFETSNPQWDWWNCDYRVKAQEPRRLMVSWDKNMAEWKDVPTIDEALRSTLVEFIELTPEIKQKLGL